MRGALLSILLINGAPGAMAGGIADPATDVGALLLADAMRAADTDKWRDAASLAARAPDPLTSALVDWRRLRDEGGEWEALSGFLAAYPGWPREARIQARAERAMPDNLSSRAVLAFFDGRRPVSGGGALRLADALIATGREADAHDLIRKTWAATPMGSTERKAFLSRHGSMVRDLHARRADEMAWRDRTADARALKPYLDTGAARLIEARAALAAREKGVDGKIMAVPAGLRDDPGLAYARFDWRLARKLGDSARDLLIKHSESAAMLGRPEYWAGGRARFARAAFRDGDARMAYRLAVSHHLTRGVSFADMEWFAGWMALTRLRDPRTAAKHFQTLYDGVSSPISRARGAYWLARAHEAAGDKPSAMEWRGRAATHDETYYGQLAASELSGAHGSPAPASGPRKPGQATLQDDRLRAALALAAAGRTDLGRGFIGQLSRDLPPQELSALSLQMLDIGQPHYALLAAKAARRNGSAPDESLFPVIDLPQISGGVDKALALAIMRQESEFNPQAISRVGARGLMQLMPGTAKLTAPKAGLSYSKGRLLSDWRYNAALGRTYLAEMLDEFGGSVPLAVAAYNAGPHRVTDWISRFGDPRRDQIDVIDWIETIPFSETRNYVQRVLEARAVYQRRLTGAPVAQSLARDLFGGRG